MGFGVLGFWGFRVFWGFKGALIIIFTYFEGFPSYNYGIRGPSKNTYTILGVPYYNHSIVDLIITTHAFFGVAFSFFLFWGFLF